MRRNAHRKHGGVNSEDYWDFRPGQRVMTREGFAGIVTDVEDGPFPGTEIYVVALDNGMGGGDYSTSELRALTGSTASVDHTAADDYPELSEILTERPPLEISKAASMKAEADTCPTCEGHGQKLCGLHAYLAEHPGVADGGTTNGRTASLDEEEDAFDFDQFMQRNAGIFDFFKDHPAADIGAGMAWNHFVRDSPASQDLRERTKYTDPEHLISRDWCRYRNNSRCMYPKELDAEKTKQAGVAVWRAHDRGYCPRVSWEQQEACPLGHAGPEAGKKGETDWLPAANVEGEYYSGDKIASLAPQKGDGLGFHLTATWQDVRAKAKAIRSDGRVRILAVSEGTIAAQVEGDQNVYQTVLTRVPGLKSVATWECGCAWAAYSWGRTGRWKKYEGRMCSHALALHLEAQSRGMWGRQIREDADTPHWLEPTIPVKVDGDWDKAKGRYSSLSTEVPDIPPVIAMAADMMDQGEDPSDIVQAFEKPFGARHASLYMKAAITIEAFLAQVDGRSVQIRIDDQGRFCLNGEPVEPGRILFPSWDPARGLAVTGSKEAAPEGIKLSPIQHQEMLNALEMAGSNPGFHIDDNKRLHVHDHDEALYWATNARDIALDAYGQRNKVKPLTKLIDTLVESAGGRDKLSDKTRSYLRSSEAAYEDNAQVALDNGAIFETHPEVSGVIREYATTPVGTDFFAGEADDLSRSYRDLPKLDPSVVPLWQELGEIMRQQAKYLATIFAIIRLDDRDPYATAEEMHADISKGRYQVTSMHSNHPVWDVDTNVAFRVCHDVMGHGRVGSDFSLRGEVEAYQAQCNDVPEHLWPALFTEIVAQAAYANVHHLFGEQKVGLIPLTQDDIDANVGKIMDAPDPEYDAIHLSAAFDDPLAPPGPFGSYNLNYGDDPFLMQPAFDPAPLDDPLADDRTVLRGAPPEPALPFVEESLRVEADGRDLGAAARALHDLDVWHEAKVTPLLGELAGTNGGQMIGLDHRFKQPARMMEKMQANEHVHKGDAGKAAANFWDGLRYTMQFPTESYTAGVSKALEGLQAKGHRVLWGGSSWGAGAGAYRGVNTTMMTPDGHKYELQFHTPESFNVKQNVNHKLYEVARKPGTAPERRAELTKQMADNAAGIPEPAGVGDLQSKMDKMTQMKRFSMVDDGAKYYLQVIPGSDQRHLLKVTMGGGMIERWDGSQWVDAPALIGHTMGLDPGHEISAEEASNFTGQKVAALFREESHAERVAKLQSNMSWLNKGDSGGGRSSGQAGPSDSDIASHARDHLAKTSAKKFTRQEQAELIGEGQNVRAANFDRLDITGTHYQALEALDGMDDTGDDLWM